MQEEPEAPSAPLITNKHHYEATVQPVMYARTKKKLTRNLIFGQRTRYTGNVLVGLTLSEVAPRKGNFGQEQLMGILLVCSSISVQPTSIATPYR